MSKLTAQALALNDAYRASGAPTSHPRLSYEKKARKAYNIRTKVTWHTSRSNGQRYFEYGDAVLHSDAMPYDQAVQVAEYLASAGFHGVVFPSTLDQGATAAVMGTSDYREAGWANVYDLTFTHAGCKSHRVELNQERHDAAWKRANER